MKPTPEEDRRLARELVPNLIIRRNPWECEPPTLAPSAAQLAEMERHKERVTRERARREAITRTRVCALCYHTKHLGKCKHCQCPD